MVDEERRSTVDANAFISRLYIDMVRILPPLLRIRSEENARMESAEEFIDLRSYRLKEVQCMWKTILRVFLSELNAEAISKIMCKNHPENSSASCSPNNDRQGNYKLSRKLQKSDAYRTSSLDIPQCSKGSASFSQATFLLSKSHSITCQDVNQNFITGEELHAGLSPIEKLPKVEIDHVADNTSHETSRQLEGFRFFFYSESNSSTASYNGEKIQTSNPEQPSIETRPATKDCINQTRRYSSNVSHNFQTRRNDCQNANHKLTANESQKKSHFKTDHNTTNSLRVLKKNQNKLKKL